MINISEELNKITNTDNYKYFALADIDNHFYVIGGFQSKSMAEFYCETSINLINGVKIKDINKNDIKIIDIVKFQNEDENLYKDTIKFIFQDLRYWTKPSISVSYDNLPEVMRELEDDEKRSSDKNLTPDLNELVREIGEPNGFLYYNAFEGSDSAVILYRFSLFVSTDEGDKTLNIEVPKSIIMQAVKKSKFALMSLYSNVESDLKYGAVNVINISLERKEETEENGLTPYGQGREAYKKGLKIEENPYKFEAGFPPSKESANHRLWKKGYNDAYTDYQPVEKEVNESEMTPAADSVNEKLKEHGWYMGKEMGLPNWGAYSLATNEPMSDEEYDSMTKKVSDLLDEFSVAQNLDDEGVEKGESKEG